MHRCGGFSLVFIVLLLPRFAPEKPGKSRAAGPLLSCWGKQTTMITQLLLAISPLFIALIGLGLIVGLISGKKASRWLGGFVLFLLLIPIRNEILRMLPLWLWLPVMAILAIRGLISVLTVLFGRGVAEHAVGTLLANGVGALLGMIGWLVSAPFRIIVCAMRSRT